MNKEFSKYCQIVLEELSTCESKKKSLIMSAFVTNCGKDRSVASNIISKLKNGNIRLVLLALLDKSNTDTTNKFFSTICSTLKPELNLADETEYPIDLTADSEAFVLLSYYIYFQNTTKCEEIYLLIVNRVAEIPAPEPITDTIRPAKVSKSVDSEDKFKAKNKKLTAQLAEIEVLFKNEREITKNLINEKNEYKRSIQLLEEKLNNTTTLLEDKQSKLLFQKVTIKQLNKELTKHQNKIISLTEELTSVNSSKRETEQISEVHEFSVENTALETKSIVKSNIFLCGYNHLLSFPESSKYSFERLEHGNLDKISVEKTLEQENHLWVILSEVSPSAKRVLRGFRSNENVVFFSDLDEFNKFIQKEGN